MGIQARNPNEDEEEREDGSSGQPLDGAYDGGLGEAVLTAIDHVGIVVPDLDEAIAQHRDAFGVVVGHREVDHAEGIEVAQLDVGSSSIWLITPLDDDSPFAEFLDAGGAGLHHVGYRVADLDAALGALRAQGAEILDDEPRTWPGGVKVAYVHPDSMHGVLVQLVER